MSEKCLPLVRPSYFSLCSWPLICTLIDIKYDFQHFHIHSGTNHTRTKTTLVSAPFKCALSPSAIDAGWLAGCFSVRWGAVLSSQHIAKIIKTVILFVRDSVYIHVLYTFCTFGSC